MVKNMERLVEMQNIIEDRLADLQQNTYFCLQDYDYHHHNNELDILKYQFELLISARATFENCIQQINDFSALLKMARQECEKADEELLRLGITSNKCSNSFEEGDESERNKENNCIQN